MMEPFLTLVGLPATGPWPEQFSATGRGSHSEGLVVEFNPGTDSSWIGNFQRGLTGYDAVVLYPDGQSVMVIAGGQGYLIDSKTRHLVGLLDSQLQNAMSLPVTKTLVINNGLWLESHGENGVRWRSRRISWDGIWDLSEADGRLSGKCWDAVNDSEESFSIDVRTGDLLGGVYPEPPD